MKIFLISSKAFYGQVPEIKALLEQQGNTVTLPNCFEDPATEARMRDAGREEHAKWKAVMLAQSVDVIREHDAVLVLNFEKNGIQNYIGGATFLEMYDAFKLGKAIYLYNDMPEGMLKDEIISFAPVILHGDLNKVTEQLASATS